MFTVRFLYRAPQPRIWGSQNKVVSSVPIRYIHFPPQPDPTSLAVFAARFEGVCKLRYCRHGPLHRVVTPLMMPTAENNKIFFFSITLQRPSYHQDLETICIMYMYRLTVSQWESNPQLAHRDYY